MAFRERQVVLVLGAEARDAIVVKHYNLSERSAPQSGNRFAPPRQ